MRRFPKLQFSMESPLRSKHPVRPLVTARRAAVRALALAGLVFSGGAAAEVTPLNVSYDPTREFYQEFNAALAFDIDAIAKYGKLLPAAQQWVREG